MGVLIKKGKCGHRGRNAQEGRRPEKTQGEDCLLETKERPWNRAFLIASEGTQPADTLISDSSLQTWGPTKVCCLSLVSPSQDRQTFCKYRNSFLSFPRSCLYFAYSVNFFKKVGQDLDCTASPKQKGSVSAFRCIFYKLPFWHRNLSNDQCLMKLQFGE